MAALHGFLDPDIMKQYMTQRVYSGWKLYWAKEPWGPLRDNMHTAILAREIARSTPGRKSIPKLESFLIRDPSERISEANKQVLSVLGTVSEKVTSKEAGKKLRAARRARKKKLAKAGRRR